MKKQVAIILLLLAANLLGQEICKIYFWDNAGDGAIFPSPDAGDVRNVRSVDMMIEAINDISRLGLPFYDIINIVGRSSSPPPLSGPAAPNIIFISLGWQGSGSAHITPDLMDALVAYIDSSYRENIHAIYIEGNDLGWEYGDTTSLHHTYTDLFHRLGGVLRTGDYGVAGMLHGADSSVAEGLTLTYNTTATGPTTSMDDIVISPSLSPIFAAQARYVFEPGKGPARGIQRPSYPGSKGPVTGAMVALALNFGNIVNGPGIPSRTMLMYRILDFLKPPKCNIVYPTSSDTLRGNSNCDIVYNVYDNCGILSISRIRFSPDGGINWQNIARITRVTNGDTIFTWRVPNIPTNNAYLEIECWDNTYNSNKRVVGPLVILGGTEYGPGHPGKIIIITKMKGVAFSLDDTNWDLTESSSYLFSPNEIAIRGVAGHNPASPFLLQNDGGVFIDLLFSVQDNYSGGGEIWTPVEAIDPSDFVTYPSLNQFYIEPWITDADPSLQTPPINETSFSGIGLTEILEEATSENWASHYTNASTSGVKIPAYVPTNPEHGDRVYLYMLFIAPSGSTTLEAHPLIFNITAELSDP